MTDSRDSREALIAAAVQLFARHGYDATTTRDIVRAAGVNISLITYYFGGKEGLMEACLTRMARHFEKYEKIPTATDLRGFTAALRQLAYIFLTAHVADPDVHRVIQREMERDSALYRRVLGTTYLEFFQRFVQIFRHGQQNGWVASDLDPITLAIALHGSMLQQVRVDHLHKEFCNTGLSDEVHLNKVVDTIVRIFLEGVRANHSKKPALTS